jgi:nucleotide-binding universal stress UspA family protein
LNHALLAYDGSLKAQEALFIASYIGARWNAALSVISIGEGDNIQEILGDARTYLEGHNIKGDFIFVEGKNSTELILQHASQLDIDLLIIGGYSRNPVLEVIQGGDVDELLRQTNIPIIICR